MREKKLHMLFIPLLVACMFLAAIFGYTYSVKAEDESSAPKIEGLEFQSEMENQFAECFHIYYYNDDYTLIDVPGSGQFLLVPEGKTAPDGIGGKHCSPAETAG